MLTFASTKMITATVVIGMLSWLSPEHQSAFHNAMFGLFGGGIFQFLTYDDRKPRWKFVIGDLLSSSVMGFGNYCWFKHTEVEVYFFSIIAGGAGSGLFLYYVKSFKPSWLPKVGE